MSNTKMGSGGYWFDDGQPVVGEVLDHLNEKKQIHMIKDVAMQCYLSVYYLSEQARILH